eukprot:4553704-Ditylum_brightwellii.AAC.1
MTLMKWWIAWEDTAFQRERPPRQTEQYSRLCCYQRRKPGRRDLCRIERDHFHVFRKRPIGDACGTVFIAGAEIFVVRSVIKIWIWCWWRPEPA